MHTTTATTDDTITARVRAWITARGDESFTSEDLAEDLDGYTSRQLSGAIRGLAARGEVVRAGSAPPSGVGRPLARWRSSAQAQA